MHIKNIFLGPLFLLIVLMISQGFRASLVKDEIDRYFYPRALWLKLLSVTFFAFIYHYYYEGGDSTGFYAWMDRFTSYLFEDFGGAMEFLFSNDLQAFYDFKYSGYTYGYGYLLKPYSREATFIRIGSVINLFSFNSYMSTSYIFALISFISNWKLYQLFSDYYPKIKKQIGWAILFIPSVSFWGAGILKDSLTFSALCIMIYAVYKIFIKRENYIKSGIWLVLSAYVIAILKGYVLFAMLPAIVYWLYGELQSNIKNISVKIVMTPVLIAVSAGFLFLLVNTIGDSLGRFSISSIDSTVKDFQGWHKIASEDGSGYDLGVSGTGIGSMLAAFPKAINVTYFRPYLWEVSGFVVFLAAIESLYFFLFFIWLFLFRGAIVRFIRAALSDPILVMCLIFFLFFGFVVGYTSYNFGALSRYKVPSMPFFAVFLVIISAKLNSRISLK